MENISGFGLVGRLVASQTFPTGFNITQFADDTDPLDIPDLQVADTGFGLNGDMLIWQRPNGIEIAIAVIAQSEDDRNLDALLEANRVGKGQSTARDEVSIVFTYPDGSTASASRGALVSGAAGKSVAAAGRYKTRVYRFRFERIAKNNG